MRSMKAMRMWTVMFVVAMLVLAVSRLGGHVPDYSRSEWRHWVNVEGCVNTRHFVLRRDSRVPVTMSDNGCQVVEGEWVGPYTGITETDPTRMDIDHRVPLGNAHVSGGWAWDSAMKRAYANDLTDAGHLVVTTARANRQKGARGPDQWRPSDESNHCEYARLWTGVKRRWGLTMTIPEIDALGVMYLTCL